MSSKGKPFNKVVPQILLKAKFKPKQNVPQAKQMRNFENFNTTCEVSQKILGPSGHHQIAKYDWLSSIVMSPVYYVIS